MKSSIKQNQIMKASFQQNDPHSSAILWQLCINKPLQQTAHTKAIKSKIQSALILQMGNQ